VTAADSPDEQSRGPLGHLVDVFVCAPIGFVLDVPSLLPRWIERGRSQLASMNDIGRVVSGRPGPAEQPTSRAGKQARAHLRGLGLVAQPPDATGDDATSTSRPAPAPTPTEPGPDVETLAITDYDALSASQVVPRLASLAPDELDAIRAYETANRGRKTILSKIAQIQAS
jgi:hypothetical protein